MRRSLIFIGVAVALAGIALGLWRPWLAQPDAVPTPTFAATFATLLKQQHFVEVPLTRSKTGYLDAMAQAQGQPLLLYLDTGNTENQVEEAVAVRLKLSRRRAEKGILAAKETDPSEVVVLEHLSLGGLQLRIEATLNSQASANQGRKELGEAPYDGLLGVEFLNDYAAVIDYGSAKLFLLDRTHEPTPTSAAERARLLKNAGYVELPLTLRENGLPDVTAEINGQPFVLLVDTGAQKVTVDESLADRLKLPQHDKPGMKH